MSSEVCEEGLRGTLYGHGPIRVVVLGGWLGQSSDWLATLDALDPERFSFLLFDYRGYGQARGQEGPLTFGQAAEDVLALTKRIGWTRFSLLGHSMGGVAMQHVLHAAPERIGSMLGVCAVPASGARMSDDRLARFVAAVEDMTECAAIVAASTGNRCPAYWAHQMAWRSWHYSDREAVGAYLKAWAQNDFSGQLLATPAATAVRVRVITGEEDPSLTPSLMEATWLRWYSDVSAVVLPGCGHYPMLETPLALARQIELFWGVP